MNTTVVVIDDRERAEPVAAALRRSGSVLIEVRRLPAGDYLVDDTLLFERKTLADLCASIKDGRLFAQGLRLTRAPQRPALILEGRSDALTASGMRREAIQGALITLTVGFGLPLLRARDAEETAAIMLLAAAQTRAHAGGALPRPGQRPGGKRRCQSYVLQGLPGVGPERARRLLEHFGSVEAVICATADDLARVPGIGDNIARWIRWAVQEPSATYA
jgi:ERCC4-type nuclease